jgi:Tfp pilus assembly protein FimT
MQLKSTAQQRAPAHQNQTAFTLMEVLIAVVLAALMFGGIISGYMLGAKRLQWAGYSLAAQTLSVQCLEQARSAVWDGSTNVEILNLSFVGSSRSYSTTNSGKTWLLTGYTTNILDIPWKGTNYLLATNYITIQQFYANNYSGRLVYLQSVRVDTVWPFIGWGNFALKYYTNSSCTYIAPDNRDPLDLGINATATAPLN